MTANQAPRGSANSLMRQATCKDCLREERARELGLSADALPDDFDKEFVYNERAAQVQLNRGHTRSDRCKRHRARHRVNTQGMAVPYIDLQTIGEAVGRTTRTAPPVPSAASGQCRRPTRSPPRRRSTSAGSASG